MASSPTDPPPSLLHVLLAVPVVAAFGALAGLTGLEWAHGGVAPHGPLARRLHGALEFGAASIAALPTYAPLAVVAWVAAGRMPWSRLRRWLWALPPAHAALTVVVLEAGFGFALTDAPGRAMTLFGVVLGVGLAYVAAGFAVVALWRARA